MVWKHWTKQKVRFTQEVTRSDKSVPRDLSARQALDGDWLQGVEPSGGVKSHENLSELDPGLLNIRCQHTT